MTENIPLCNHTSVGMIVKNGGKILLIKKMKFPFCYAPPAGHADDGESFEKAAKRELKEEVGIKATELNRLIEGRKENPCRRPDGSWHYWKIYSVGTDDFKIKKNEDEAKEAGWYSADEIKKLVSKTAKYLDGNIPEEEWQKSPGLEPVWYEWFKEMGIL